MSHAAHAVLWGIIGALLVAGTAGAIRMARTGRRDRLWDSLLVLGWTAWWTEAGVTAAAAWMAPPGEAPAPAPWPDRDLGFDLRLPTWSLPTAERRPARRHDAWRVAVLGDSFVAGAGVRAGETLPEQLETRLAELAPGSSPEVWNLGVPSFGAPAILEHLIDEALPLAPDVIVWVHVLNDLPTTPILGLSSTTAVHDGISVLAPPGSRGPWWTLKAGVEAVGRIRRERAVVQAYVRGHEEDVAAGAVDDLVRDLAPWVDAQRARGGRFVIAVYPLLFHLDDYPFREAHALVLDVARRVGAEPIDLLPGFEGRDAASLWASRSDHHPNAAGHALAADRLARALVVGPIARAGPVSCPTEPPMTERPKDRLARARALRCLEPEAPTPALELAEAWLDLPMRDLPPMAMPRVHAGLALAQAVALARLGGTRIPEEEVASVLTRIRPQEGR